MQRLAQEDAHLACAVFAVLDEHLAVLAALAGETPAEIHVDDPRHPQAGALLPWNRHRIYLAGAPADPAFADALSLMLHRRYLPSSPDARPVDAIIYYAPDSWEPILAALLADIRSQRAERHYYHLSVRPDVPTYSLPAGFVLRGIEPDVWEDDRITNRDDLLSEILSESHSVEDFLRNKFGYCAQCDDELVGWCLSEYNHGHCCELGVETVSQHQRRGVALGTASATIAQAFDQGITEIGWHCWSANAASVALATRLGFERVSAYPVWFCQFGAQPYS